MSAPVTPDPLEALRSRVRCACGASLLPSVEPEIAGTCAACWAKYSRTDLERLAADSVTPEAFCALCGLGADDPNECGNILAQPCADCGHALVLHVIPTEKGLSPCPRRLGDLKRGDNFVECGDDARPRRVWRSEDEGRTNVYATCGAFDAAPRKAPVGRYFYYTALVVRVGEGKTS